MYAKRNSLTILAVLVLLSSVGFFWYRSQAKNLSRETDNNRRLSEQLRGSLEVAETLVKVTAERDVLQKRWETAPKKILNTQEPAFSLSYINWLIRTHGLVLDFDFYLNDTKPNNEYTIFTYTLNGEGDYSNICALVWHITHNTLLYRIKNVTLRRSENDPKLVNFVIQFEGFSMNKDWEVGGEVAMASLPFNWDVEFGRDAFASLMPVERKPEPKLVVAPPPKPQEPPGLFEVQGATLLAITNDTAYLRAADGKVASLKVGDPVRHRGRLTRLDPKRNQVEFMIENENGSTRLVQLNIEYN